MDGLYERNQDGTWAMRVTIVDGGGGGSVTWDDIAGKPAVIAAGADAAAARAAIGAGTSSQNLTALTAGEATTGTATTARAITAAVLAGAINERTKGKEQITSLTPIADPSTATAEDVASLLNSLIAALKA